MQFGNSNVETGRICQLYDGERVSCATKTTLNKSQLYPLLSDPTKKYVKIQVIPGRDMTSGETSYIYGEVPVFQCKGKRLKRWFLQKAGGAGSLRISAETGRSGVGDNNIKSFGGSKASNNPADYTYYEAYVNYTDYKERFGVSNWDGTQTGFSFWAEEEKPNS